MSFDVILQFHCQTQDHEQENLKELKYFMPSQPFKKETRSNLGFILSVDSKSMSKSPLLCNED